MSVAMCAHLPKSPISTKDLQRLEIDQHVAEYLARGGTVASIDHTDNQSYGEPVRRSRRQQVDHMKRFGTGARRGE